jgi:HAMP domain-containing protein
VEAEGNLPGHVKVVERLATVLGESAKLLERVEFTPTPPAAPRGSRHPRPAQAPPVPGQPRPRRPHPLRRVPPDAPPAVAPPPPLVEINLNEVMAEVEKEIAKNGVPPEAAAHLRDLAVQLGPALQTGLRMAGSATQSAATALSEQVNERMKERAMRARERAAVDRRVALAGETLAIPVWRRGEMVGSVNARLNLPRTFAVVLGSAQPAQGEIPFAIDADGVVHAATPDQERQLRALNVVQWRRTGVRQQDDWVIVTREAPSDITFGIARPIAQSLREIQRASVRSLSLGLGVIGLALLGIVPLSRRMTRNLTTLTDGVQRIAQGDFSARVPVRSRDEFGALATAFNRMAHDVEHRQHLVVERERLQRELELCRRIQTEMLPHAPLRLGPTEIKGISIPAREVGGDFFNYFELPGGTLAVLVGDVSGKGISAALLMANIQATLRARLPLEPDLARLTATIDQENRGVHPGGCLRDAVPRHSRPAGQDAALRQRRPPPPVPRAGRRHRPALDLRHAGGALRRPRLHRAEVQLAEGDVLFFYTDGLVEVENESGDMFGAERLESLLRHHAADGVDLLLDRAEADVRAFRGGAEPFDDVTLMAVRLGGGA